MWLKYVFIFLILVGSVSAATVHGTVYDWQLNPKENVIVEVNSKPKQVVVAKDGDYSFNLPQRDYIIKAYYKEDNVVVEQAEEKISVKEEGDFVIDLILSEVIDEDLLTEIEDIDVEGLEEEKRTGLVYVTAIIVAVVVIILALFFIFFRVKKEEESDEEAEKVLNVIKKSKGRITQRSIRKALPSISEAKVSLIITDLESKKIVRKIKKGRGNIIILERK